MNEYPLVFRYEDRVVKVCQHVIEQWLEHRQSCPEQDEQFGVIIGGCIETEQYYWLDDLTLPCRKDQATRHSFLMKDPYHQHKVNQCFIDSEGKLGYIGTWHTHPQLVPHPSQIDLADWKRCMARNQDRCLVFVIVGTEEIAAFIGIAGSIQKMEIEKDMKKEITRG